MATHTSEFNLKEKCTVDDDKNLIGIITCIAFRTTNKPLYELSWIHNGDSKVAWFEEHRLDLAI